MSTDYVGALPRPFEQRADIVRRHDLGIAPRRGERRIAIACGDVEDALVAAQVDGLAQVFADDLKRDADGAIVAGAPGGLLPPLDPVKIRSGSRKLDVHVRVSFARALAPLSVAAYLGSGAAAANDHTSVKLDQLSEKLRRPR